MGFTDDFDKAFGAGALDIAPGRGTVAPLPKSKFDADFDREFHVPDPVVSQEMANAALKFVNFRRGATVGETIFTPKKMEDLIAKATKKGKDAQPFLYAVAQETAKQGAYQKEWGAVADAKWTTRLGYAAENLPRSMGQFGAMLTGQGEESSWYSEAIKTMQSARPQRGDTWVTEQMLGAVDHIPLLAASAVTAGMAGKVAVAAGAAAKTAAIAKTAGATAFWVAEIAPGRYGEYRKAGLSHGRALPASIISAIPEAIVETGLGKMGSGGFLEALGKGTFTSATKRVLFNIGKEYLKELAEEPIQEAISQTFMRLFATGMKKELTGPSFDEAIVSSITDSAGVLAFLMLGGGALSTTQQQWANLRPSRSHVADVLSKMEGKEYTADTLPSWLQSAKQRRTFLANLEKGVEEAKASAVEFVKAMESELAERGGEAFPGAPTSLAAQEGGEADAVQPGQEATEAAQPQGAEAAPQEAAEVGELEFDGRRYRKGQDGWEYYFASADRWLPMRSEAIVADLEAGRDPHAAEAAPAAQKQPWEMSRDEFSLQVPVRPLGKGEMAATYPDGTRFRFNDRPEETDKVDYARRRVIQKAISEGRTVPAEVLADYPGLQKSETQQSLGRLAEMEQSGEVDAEVAATTRYLLEEVAPDVPIDVALRISEQARVASAEQLAEFPLEVEGADHTLGETRTKIEQGLTRAAVTLYKGHDATTAAHEWAHAFLNTVIAADEAGQPAAKELLGAYMDYHDAQNDGMPKGYRGMSERFAREFADTFMLDKPHAKGRVAKIGRAMRRLARRFRDFVARVFGTNTSASRALVRAGMDPQVARKLFGEQAADAGTAAAGNEAAPHFATGALSAEEAGERSAIEVLGRYFADLAEAKARARADAVRLEKDVRAANKALPKAQRKGTRFWREAILVHIDFLNAQERGFGTPDEVWAVWKGSKDSKITKRQDAMFAASQALPPSIQVVADEIIAINDMAGQAAKRAGIIKEPYKNYIARMWAFAAAGGSQATSLKTSTKHAKPRVYDSVAEGWALGHELRVKDAITAMRSAREDVAAAIYGRRLIAEGLNLGAYTIDTRRVKEMGWKQVKLWNFTHYRYAGSVVPALARVKTLEEMQETAEGADLDELMEQQRVHAAKAMGIERSALPTELMLPDDLDKAITNSRLSKGKVYGHRRISETAQGDIIDTQVPIYASPKWADKLNSIFGKSKLSGLPVFDVISQWNATIKASILLSSFFHHTAFIRSFVFAGRQGLSRYSIPVVGGVLAYRDGKKHIDGMSPEATILIREGMTIDRRQDWDEDSFRREQTGVGKIIDRVPGGKQAKDALLWLYEKQTRFLFNHLGPNLKVMAGILEYRHAVNKRQKKLESGETTNEEIAGQVGRLMNDDFGGENLPRLIAFSPLGRWYGPTAQHVKRLGSLAPDWTESNIRMMVKAFGRGDEAAMYRAAWARVAMKGLTATALFGMLLAATDDDEDWWENLKTAWKIGNFKWLDIDVTAVTKKLPKGWGRSKPGSRVYWSLLGHLKDPIKFATALRSQKAASRIAKGKSSVVGRSALDFMTGEDWRGARFTTWDELWGVDDKGRYKTAVPFRHSVGQRMGGKDKGKLTTWARDADESTNWLSFALYEARQWTPIQVQNALAYWQGELSGLDALTGSLGVPARTVSKEQIEARKRR